jgi:hypothetical protein
MTSSKVNMQGMEAQNDFLDNLGAIQHEKMLREIVADELTPKKKKFNANIAENDLFDVDSGDGELWNPDKVV